MNADHYPDLHIRWMFRRECEEVLDIDAQCGGNLTSDDLMRCLRERSVTGMVAEDSAGSNAILGYMIYDLNPRSVKLLHFAVDPKVHRRGVGRRLMSKLICKVSHLQLSSPRRNWIDIAVSESSLGAQLFLRKQGFRAAFIFRDPDGDSYGMRYLLPQESPVAEMIDGRD